MVKKILPLFVLVTLAACLLSYKLGSAPTAHAQIAQTLPPPPNEWAVSDREIGTAAVATRAGASGVQHVADCISIVVMNTSPPGNQAAYEVALLDGSVTLMQWWLAAPADTTGQGEVHLCGLNLQGSAGNPMTLEFQISKAGGIQSVNLVGHDAT